MISRRSFSLAVAAALAAAALPLQAFAQGASIGDVRVDTTALRRGGWGGPPLAAFERTLQTALRDVFAGRIAPGAPTLVVRVESIALAAYAGADSVGGRGVGGGGGASQNDTIDGELLLVGRGGAILSRQPLLSVLPSFSAASWWSADGEVRRMAALASAYAFWARRQLG